MGELDFEGSFDFSVRSDNEHSEMESTEADTDALLVTELWIEPQYGFLRTSSDEQQGSTRLDLFEQVRCCLG